MIGRVTALECVMARWRNARNVCTRFTWLTNGLWRSRCVVAALLCLAVAAQSATVPFEITFTHSGTTPPKRPLAHIFVLDRSGSMVNRRDAECERNGKMVPCNRWEALKDSLRKTLANTPDKTELRFIIVDGDRREKGFLLFEKDGIKSDNGFFSWVSGGKEMTDTIIMSDKYREPSKISAIIKKLGEPGGNTPLYDTLQDVMLKSWDLFKDGKRVSVFVFSDGDNVGGRLRTEDALKRSLISEHVPSNIVSHISFLPIWVSKSRPDPKNKLFDTDWLEPGTVPMVATVVPLLDTVVLDNPLSGNPISVKLGYDFKVSDDIWVKIQKYAGELILCDRNGQRLAGYPIGFKASQNVAINIDDKYLSPTQDNVFQVKLRCDDFPKESYITCDKPDPIRVTFTKAGEVSVAIVSPRSSQVVKSGEKGEVVKFEAMVSPANAECEWDFGDGSPAAHGVRVEHRYLKSDTFAYSVRAKVKDRSLIPGTAKGSIAATNASVSLVVPKEKVDVGEQMVVKAIGEGPVSRYVWSVAGIDMEGSDAKDGSSSEFRWKPEAPGKVAISVRAIMKGEMKSESDSKIVSVEAKPYVGIVSPKPGFVAEIGTPFSVVARVVNVDAVKFNVYGKEHALVVTQVGSAIKDNVSETMLNLKEAGNFQIEVEGGNGTVKSVPIDISIKAEQLKVFIDSPKNGEPCKTSEHKNIVAHVKGSKVLLDECGGLVWEVNGVPIPNGSGKINDKGEMSAIWTIPDELAWKECVLRAYALDRTGTKTSAYDEVTIEPSIEGAINIVEPSNGKHVSFDSAFDLAANTTGRAKGVSWFAEGVSEPIGHGKKCEYRVRHIGQKKAVIRIHAEADMPGGTPLKSDEVVVTAICPDIKAKIQQPATNSIGRTKEYTVNITGSGVDRLESGTIVWDMGDGTIYTNKGISVTHKYTNYGTYTIKASGCCAKCREPVNLKAPASVVVEKQPISAAFTILASATSPKAISGTIAQGRQVTLIGQVSPDIARREWTCNGQIILGDDGKPKQGPSIEYRCKDVGEYVFGLTVYDDAGSAVGPEKHALKTYRLWAILLIAFVCLIVWVILVLYWKGDDLRFWEILVRIDEEGSTPFISLRDKQPYPAELCVGDKWNKVSNVAEFAMGELTEGVSNAGNWACTLGNLKVSIKAVEKNKKLGAKVESGSSGLEVVPDQVEENVFRVISGNAEDKPVVLELVPVISDKTHLLYITLSFVALTLLAVGVSKWLAW